MHVKKSERVGLRYIGRSGWWRIVLDANGLPKVGVVVQVVDGISVTPCGATAGAARIFPFRFGRKAIVLALFLAEPSAECHGIIPGNANDRGVVRLWKTGASPVNIRCHAVFVRLWINGERAAASFSICLKPRSFHELAKGPDGYFMDSKVEWLADAHPVRWSLVVLTVF